MIISMPPLRRWLFNSMIKIKKSNNRITVSGHANYAPAGQDIVCAGISTLVQTLISSIEELTDDKIKYDISPGRVDIELRNVSADTELLVGSFFCGVRQIAESYPDYVKLLNA